MSFNLGKNKIGWPISTDDATGLVYKGTWDALLNIPALMSSVGVGGEYYIVSVAGTTNLDGVTDWQVGDWAIFNGTTWQKIDNSGISYQGTWDALTNNPTLTSSVGFDGRFYIVNVDGTTNLNGIASWQVGDWAIFTSGVWLKIGNTDYGITTLNGLTTITQTFGVGTNGTDFNINSLVDNHTFNLPTASSLNRGALSSSDWTTFNNKQNALGFTPVPDSRNLTINGVTQDLTANRSWTISTASNLEIKNEGVPLTAAATSIDFTGDSVTASAVGTAVTVNVTGGGSVSGTTNTVAKFTSSTAVGNSLITDNGTTVTLPSLNVNGAAGAGYLTLIGQSANPTSPTPGTLLLHSKTVNTFTRLEQDNEATTNLVYGRDNVIICKNDTGVTILKGQVVYTSGVVSNTPQISLARANASGTLPAVGVAVDDILHNTFGQVMTSGILSFNTSVFSADDRVYVSPTTAGSLTATRPSGTTNLVQRIGTILVSSATPTIGQMLVAVSPSVLNMETGTIAASFTAASFIATGLSTAGYVTNTAGGVLGTKTIIEAVQFFFDGQGVVINANTTATMEIPYSGTIVGWTLLEVSNTPVSSTIVIDTWKAAYSSYPPVVGGTIWGTKPALTAVAKNTATGLSIAVTAGDIIKCNIDSNTAALKVKLILHIQRA